MEMECFELFTCYANFKRHRRNDTGLLIERLEVLRIRYRNKHDSVETLENKPWK